MVPKSRKPKPTTLRIGRSKQPSIFISFLLVERLGTSLAQISSSGGLGDTGRRGDGPHSPGLPSPCPPSLPPRRRCQREALRRGSPRPPVSLTLGRKPGNGVILSESQSYGKSAVTVDMAGVLKIFILIGPLTH